MRVITDQQRRALLGRRHGLEPGHQFSDVVHAARGLVALHATEPATVYLSAWARIPGVAVEDVDAALYQDRSMVKQLAMRRTLWAFPRELLPAVWGSASARVAEQQRRRIASNVESAGLASDGDAWLAEVRDEVLALVAGTDGVPAQVIRESVPQLDGSVATGAGGKWGGPVPIAPRVLTWLGARAELVRGVNAGHWRVSRPAWTTMTSWLGDQPEPLGERTGYVALVRRWLARFGPGTEGDLVWWLGATKSAVRRALVDAGAVEVRLEGDRFGWMLPGDLDRLDDDLRAPRPWAALLPTLDPTTMGWQHRDFYLDPADRPHLFDANGNAGATAWWNGRVVGCWVQDDSARVEVVLAAKVPAPARAALEEEAERLTAWLGGVRVANVYSSPAMKRARLP